MFSKLVLILISDYNQLIPKLGVGVTSINIKSIFV